MANILHRIEINERPEKIYPSFATLDGLRKWWTDEVSASGEIKTGTVIHFRFGVKGSTDMKVIKAETNKRLEWECVGGGTEWLGTKFFFDLTEENNKTVLRFGQTGWKEATDFYMHCNCRWAYYLLSMKSYVEKGKGTPFPEAIDM